MQATRWLLVSCLALPSVACNGAPRDEASASERAHAPAERPRESTPKPRDELLTAGEPALPPPVAGARFGATPAELAELLPGLDGRSFVDPEDETLSFWLSFAQREELGGLESIAVELGATREQTRALLVARWGEPRVDEERTEYWFGPAQGIRATLAVDARAVVFSAFAPAATIIGEGQGAALGFEAHAPLRGMSLDTLERTYGEHLHAVAATRVLELAHGDTIAGSAAAGRDGWPELDEVKQLMLVYPPAEFGSAPTYVFLFADQEDRVASYRVVISAGKRYDASEDILAALAGRFGEPKAKRDWLIYTKDLSAHVDAGRVKLRVGG